MEEIDMLKAGELCVDDVFAAASNVGLLTAADPSRKPNPVKGGTRMGYRVGLTALVVAATLNLISCDGDDNRPTPDTTPPTVVSIIPANGATNVAVSTTVSANFSEPLDCTSVTAASFTLTSAGAVAGSISCSGSSVTFTPASTLSFNTTYTVTVGTAVRDAAGNALASAFTSTYTSVLPPRPETPTGVTAMPGNAQATLSWPAVPGATSYNVYTSASTPVTTNNTKTSVDTTGATLSSLTNGTPVFAAVTAVNAGGESALSTGVCAVPTAASTAGLTLYNPLCGGTLDGNKWRTPLFSRSVSGGALVLSSQISNMESRTVQGLFYPTAANVNAGAQRVTTLKADLTVPAATASRTDNAEIRAVVQLSYQPPANRLIFPGGNLEAIFIQIGLIDAGGGLQAFRRVFHCDNASCTSRISTGIAFVDPAGFTPNTNGIEADAAAVYDTTYTVSASLNESTGVFSWSFAGGAFGAGVAGTADPSTYLAGNTRWTALGANPLAGPGFFFAALRTQVWDDFSGTGANSGPTELSEAKWTTPGKTSLDLTVSSLAVHTQITSLSTAGLNNFQGTVFQNPAGLNTLQADVTVSACSNSLAGTNRVSLEGTFYNDGTPGTTPPNTNQPNSLVGDIQAYLFLDCVADVARFQILRWNNTTQPLSSTLLSSFANSIVQKGPATVTGNTHTLTMKSDPVTHFLTFQVDGGTPVVVDPTTVNTYMTTAAPYAKPANSPGRTLGAFLSVPPSGSAVGATASMDFTVNNVFTAP